jgi:hypothetical protein
VELQANLDRILDRKEGEKLEKYVNSNLERVWSEMEKKVDRTEFEERIANTVTREEMSKRLKGLVREEEVEKLRSYIANKAEKQELNKKADRSEIEKVLERKPSENEVKELGRYLDKKMVEIREELYKKPDRDEVAEALGIDENFSKLREEMNEIKANDKLYNYYCSFMNVFSGHMIGVKARGSRLVEGKNSNLASIKEIIPVPAIRELVGILFKGLDIVINARTRMKVDKFLELANKTEMEKLGVILARKVAIAKKEEIKQASKQKEDLDKIFTKLNKAAFAGDIEYSCKSEVEKLAYKDASKVIAGAYSGCVTINRSAIEEELLSYAIIEDRKLGEKLDRAINKSEGIEEGAKIIGSSVYKIKEAETDESKCTVMNLNKIEYDNPEIDRAMKEGDVESLKAALRSSEQEDNSLEAYLETDANLEEFQAANNMERGVLEEIIEGIYQIDVPDSEPGHSSYQIEQECHNQTIEDIEISELGGQNTQEENL